MILQGGHVSTRYSDGVPVGTWRRATYPWTGITPGTLWLDQPQQEWPDATATLAAVEQAGNRVGDSLEVDVRPDRVRMLVNVCVTRHGHPSEAFRHGTRRVYCGQCGATHTLVLGWITVTAADGWKHQSYDYVAAHRLYDELDR